MTLAAQIRDARGRVAKRSRLVRRCQRRVDKWKAIFAEAKRHKRVRRRRRAKRKILYWTRREADAIEANRSIKARLRRLLHLRASLQPKGKVIAQKAIGYIGTREGSTLQRTWANRLGYSAFLPWCSIFYANMLIEAGLYTVAQLKAKVPNPAYSGAWIGAPGMRRVNRSEIQLGDGIILDWGDGGLTDHIAVFVGGGEMVGGNQSDAVTRVSVPWGNVVAIVRPY